MPMQDREDRDASLGNGEVHQIWEAMDNGHAEVIENDRESQRLLLNRSVHSGKFVRELLAEAHTSCLVPQERVRDIGLCDLPNEQARHLCAARSELLNRLAPRLARVAVRFEFGPAHSQQLGIGD